MPQSAITHSTFTIERAYAASPERVFAAFADPAVKRRWFADDKGRDLEIHDVDFRVGGGERTVSRFLHDIPIEGAPKKGAILTNQTSYQDIVPGRRIVFAYTMALGDHRFSASLATVELLPSGTGTTLVFTEQGAYFEGSDGAQMREHGWRQLLEKLAHELA